MVLIKIYINIYVFALLKKQYIRMGLEKALVYIFGSKIQSLY